LNIHFKLDGMSDAVDLAAVIKRPRGEDSAPVVHKHKCYSVRNLKYGKQLTIVNISALVFECVF